MRKLGVLAVGRLLLSLAKFCYGQQGDVAFGVGTLSAPSASSASGSYSPQSMGGGAYPVFSGDFLFWHHFGAGAEVSWRASQSNYTAFGALQPFRPIFYDFNGVYGPTLGKHLGAEIMAGIGAVSLRFYQPFFNCSFSGCTNYVSSNHFLGHFGGGLKLYVHGGFFVRPEAHFYLIRNNFEFSSARATRYGISIGYTFRPLR
jgi:hypothetical protein